MKVCAKCGTQLEDIASFCNECGEPVSAAATPQGANTQIPGTNTQIPGANTQVPGDNTQVPGDNTQIPGANTQVPGDNTQVPGDNTQVPGDNTQVPGDNTQIPGGAAQAAGGTTSGVMLAPGQSIVLNGQDCTIESRIKSSGEAVVYTIKINGKQYIFKHYHSNRPLNDTAKEVLTRIKNSPHDRIIKIIDFGKYNNQDYEIMEFAEGGTLDEYLRKNAIHDDKKFKNIVKMINEGLQQLHGIYNFIWQDLKPENILFKDAKQAKIVLADFGISNIMETGQKRAQVVASLTDLYGAPELSPKSGHKHVIATPAVDYYSLGMTMFEMWLGGKPFHNIPAVQRDYLISEGSVDFPADMPDECKTLIQGFFKHRKERWGDEHIQLWLSGKPLQQAAGKANLGYATEMFNDTESYSSPKELADLMAKYPNDGVKILYSGIAAKWFEKSGRGLRAEEIKEVAEAYVQDKKSGYYVAVYKIDPTRPWISKGGKACRNPDEIVQALTAESAYYMEDLKKPNAQLYLYLTAVEGAKGVEASEVFCKYFTESGYSPRRALSLTCLRLQNNCITIGQKKYESPEELTQEDDPTQKDLIKKALMETDSLLLVWLSGIFQDKLPAANAFTQQPVAGQFFLLSLFPYLSFKEIDPNWQTNASKILLGFITDSPGRADLFEAYAAQGLPLNDKFNLNIVRAQTPINYIVDNFYGLSRKHGEDTIVNLIRLLVKLGANPKASADSLLMAVKTSNVSLVKLMLDLGTDQAKRNEAYKYVAKKTNINASDKAIMRLLNPTGLTKALLVPGRILRVIGMIFGAIFGAIGWVFEKIFKVIDDIADDMNDEVPSFIFSGIFALAIALGSWAVLGRVFGLGTLWNVLLFILIITGSFILTAVAFGYRYIARPLNLFFALIFAITGGICFFTIPKPAEPENPAPVELTVRTITTHTATVTSDALNMRKTPSGSGELVKTLRRGNTLNVTGDVTENGWMPVEHSGDYGYVSEDFITIEDNTEYIVQTATVTSNNVKMRKTPANSYSAIQTLKRGDTVNIAGGFHLTEDGLTYTENGWILVEHSGDFGYISTGDISMNSGQLTQAPLAQTTPTQTTPTQTTPTTSTTPTQTTPTQTTPVQTTGQRATVTKGTLTMRETPTMFGKTVKRLNQGDIVNIAGERTKGGNILVEHNGAVGYVYLSLLSLNNVQTSTTPAATTPTQTTTPSAQTVTRGRLTFGNDVYDGDIVNGKAHGKGKYTYASGTVYEGDFVNGDFNGKGKMTWTDGEFYEGDFVNDKRSGKGKYTWNSGSVYEGDFIDGHRTGKGKYTWGSGTAYNGHVYEGDFVDGVSQGKGKYTWTDGAVYEGDWVNDSRTGKGKYIFPSGTVYEGDFVDGKFQGKGKMVWKDGDVYEGDFVNDLRHGRGKYTYANGTIEDGRWENGSFVGR
jgi:uncharacterized protein YraI